MSLSKILAKTKPLIKRIIVPKVPKHLSSNFRYIDAEKMQAISESIQQNYFSRQIWGDVETTSDAWSSSDEGKADLHDHLEKRLDEFRQMIVPWLNSAKPLAGARILEIGCGTGASTVALAEQGAKVVAIDIDEESLAVAKCRCSMYRLKVDFFTANATDMPSLFSGYDFNFIIFFASLEHLTLEERIHALKGCWNMLSQDNLLCIIETPNRLWYFDNHTSLLPFFHWLPDELAFLYSRFSPRQPFCESYRALSDDGMQSFLRHGRGVSFHEFDISIKKAEELDVVSSLFPYIRYKSWFGLTELAWRFTRMHRYESFLRRVGPHLHKGFYEPRLDLIIRKA